MRLDETALNYSDNMFLILKDHWPSTTQSSYYIELRPTIHNFQYESGLNLLKEHDQFVLQSFQIQLGVGKNIF